MSHVWAKYADMLLAASKPSFVNGAWRKPRLGAMALAALRKDALVHGETFPIPDKVRKELRVQPPKGHKFLAAKEEREARIQEGLAKMPKLIADYRKEKAIERAESKKNKGVYRVKDAVFSIKNN
eukprot:Opistho-2@66008